jgi:hypothetical protein
MRRSVDSLGSAIRDNAALGTPQANSISSAPADQKQKRRKYQAGDGPLRSSKRTHQLYGPFECALLDSWPGSASGHSMCPVRASLIVPIMRHCLPPTSFMEFEDSTGCSIVTRGSICGRVFNPWVMYERSLHSSFHSVKVNRVQSHDRENSAGKSGSIRGKVSKTCQRYPCEMQ